MKVTPIDDALKGEHVVGIHPNMSPEIDYAHLHRMNLYPGRSLSDLALTTEQDHRSQHMALLGRRLSHGVVSGLEVHLDERSESGDAWQLIISGGRGIAYGGEDVALLRSSRVWLRDIPVYGPRDIILTSTRTSTSSAGDSRFDDELGFRMGISLGNHIDRNAKLPRAGILVLRPVQFSSVGNYDPGDPCEECRSQYAYEDWRRNEACQLVLYCWPEDVISMPSLTPSARWRNSLANAVFDYERKAGTDPVLPWDRIGVPVGLIGFSAEYQPLFLDRHAVVRFGGRSRQFPLVPGDNGQPRTWQARYLQFNSQIAQLKIEGEKTSKQAGSFRWLPPVGLLPRDAAVPREKKSEFFPSYYDVAAVPIAREQLDLAVDASMSLAPFDLKTPDHVQILVPVPQAVYDPDLLKIEHVDPTFTRAIRMLFERANNWLARRESARKIEATLDEAISGPPDIPVKETDSEAVRGEDHERGNQDFDKDGFGTKLKDDGATLEVVQLESLRDLLVANSVVKAAEADTVFAEGLQKYTEELSSKIEDTNDRIDFLFMLVQSNVYRVRQFMLGGDSATRLATSPFLAQIAKGESTSATRQEIAEFYRNLKKGGNGGNGADEPRGTAPRDDGGNDAAGTGRGSRTPGGGSSSSGGSGRGGRGGRHLSVTGLSDPSSSGGRSGGRNPGGGSGSGFGGRSFNFGFGRRDSDFVFFKPGTEKEKPDVSPEDVKALTKGESILKLAKSAEKDDVLHQSPVVGKEYEFRTMTLANRLDESPANESKAHSIAIAHEAVKGLMSSGLNLDGLEVAEVHDPESDTPYNKFGVPNRRRRKIEDFKNDADNRLLGHLLNDPDPEDADEASFFSEAVAMNDRTIATLRRVEGMLQKHRSMLKVCHKTLAQLKKHRSGVDKRLQEIDSQLIEVRHDLRTGLTLLDDERRRVREINRARDAVLAEHVKFLVYHRPRTLDNVAGMPVRDIYHDLVQTQPPYCSSCDLEIPKQLEAMTELLRDMPIGWFPTCQVLLKQLNRIQSMTNLFLTVKERSGFRYDFLSSHTPDWVDKRELGKAVQKTYEMSRGKAKDHREYIARMDYSVLKELSWQQQKSVASELVTPGDMIEGDHGNSAVVAKTSRLLRDITHMAGHLYHAFLKIDPAMRMKWVTTLSQYDSPVNLRALSSLHRWGEVEYEVRVHMQKLVDWLFQQIRLADPKAEAVMSDIVRCCILLASHAPVDKIVSGHVDEAKSVNKGDKLDITVPTKDVAIGQIVEVFDKDQMLRAVVENITKKGVHSRVIATSHKTINLEVGAKAQVGVPIAVKGKVYKNAKAGAKAKKKKKAKKGSWRRKSGRVSKW